MANRVVTSFLGANVRTIVIAGSSFFTPTRAYQGGGGIPYSERIDAGDNFGFRESLTPEATTATKVVEVAWGRRREFLITMLGTTYPSANRLARVLPQAFSADYPHLYCTGADLTYAFSGPTALIPDAGPTQDCGDAVFQTARYSLNFSRLKYELLSDALVLSAPGQELSRYVEREMRHSADNFTVPSGSFRWVTLPHDAIQEGGVPKVFAARQVDYTWHDIPEFYMPTVRQRIEQAIGRVNLVAFDRTTAVLGGSAGVRGYPAETMFLLGANEEPTGKDSGLPFVTSGRLYKVKFSFLYRNNGIVSGAGNTAVYAGWNHLLRGPSYTPQFQLATADGTANGTSIYGVYNMFNLFEVNPNLP